MADVLRNGMAWLAGKMKDHASESVTITRGAHSVTVQATVGKTLLSLQEGYGARVEWTDADFLITAADYVLNGVVTLPQRGDVFRRAFETGTIVFKAMAPGEEPVWRWADEHRLVLRIHAKQVGTE